MMLRAGVTALARRPELCHIALGANQGQRLRTLRLAIESMMKWPGFELIAASRPYRSRPVDARGGEFLNAVIAANTVQSPQALLADLLALENKLGRVRQEAPSKPSAASSVHASAPKHQARPIDLDLLTHGQRRMNTQQLTLPHPRMNQRAFVLAPMADIAPHHVLATGRTVLETLGQLPDRDDVWPLELTPGMVL
jgi:2-amino-4-hydroxy-6-hydroxymethyldihydropteridine diphosphokinase